MAGLISPIPTSVVLHAAGNSQIGIGHLSRTATLAAALRINPFWHRVILLWEASPSLVEHFAPKDCEIIAVRDFQSGLNIRFQLAQTAGLWVLITDLLNLKTEDMVTARTQGFRLLGYLNDSGTGRSVADLLIDEDAFKTSADLPADFQGIGLVGNAYRIIRPEVAQKRPAVSWRGDQVNRVLVSLGGADPGNLTLQLLRELLKLGLPESLLITVVIGPAFNPEHTDQLQALGAAHTNLQAVQSPSCMATLLLEQDLVITLGGLTFYEACCLGKPCAAIAWSYMSFYVDALSHMGMVSNLGTIQQASVNLLQLIQNPTQLRTLAKRGWEMIDGQGANRIAAELVRLANQTYSNFNSD